MFCSDLATVSCIPDPELALENVSSIFIPLADKHAPFKQFRVKDRSNPWFSSVLSELIQVRNQAWAKARKTDSVVDWQSFRQLRNRCTILNNKDKSSYFLSSISDSAGDPSNFWKTVNALQHTNSSSSSTKQVLSGFNNIFLVRLFIWEKQWYRWPWSVNLQALRWLDG